MNNCFRGLAALTAGLCLGGAALSGAPLRTDTPKAVIAQSGPPMGLTLGMDKPIYTRTDTNIHAVLTLFNHAATPLVFTEHGRRFEWQIVDAQGSVVWDYAKGRMFPHFVVRRSLVQGQLDYAFDVPLTTQEGKPLPPGNYTLRGLLAISLPMSGEIGFSVGK